LQTTGRFRRRQLSLAVRPDSPKPLGRSRTCKRCRIDQRRCLTQAPQRHNGTVSASNRACVCRSR
jgi:hypothetical protein